MLSWRSNAQVAVTASSAWSIASSLNALTSLRLIAPALLTGNSTLAADIFILQNKMTATLSGTTTLLAKVAQRWSAQSTYPLSSDLSAPSLQVWNSRATISPTLSYRMFPNQRMFPSAQWPLSSDVLACIGKWQYISLDIFVIPSKLRVDTIIHRQEHPSEGHYTLHGNIKNKTRVLQISTVKRLRGGSKVKHIHPSGT
jgi:hypothetical protein